MLNYLAAQSLDSPIYTHKTGKITKSLPKSSAIQLKTKKSVFDHNYRTRCPQRSFQSTLTYFYSIGDKRHEGEVLDFRVLGEDHAKDKKTGNPELKDQSDDEGVFLEKDHNS
jgi:hypothetical protein